MWKPMGAESTDSKKGERKKKKEELVVTVTRGLGAPTYATSQECHWRDNPKS